jgi:hypothetical protein
MRASIWFDYPTDRDEKFVNKLLAIRAKYPGDHWYQPGWGGLGVEHVSWNDAFKFATEVTWAARNEGANVVKSMRTYVQDDVEETDLDALFSHWTKSGGETEEGDG